MAGSRRTPKPGANKTREEKTRILEINERRGEFKGDIGGRRESFRVDEPRLLRRLEVGDLVIITVEDRMGDDVVIDIRTAAEAGRVLRVDKKNKLIVIDHDGNQQTYRVDNRNILDDVRVGDKIRFEFEDRPGGVKVMTEIQ
jgi:hypothetical protein